MWITGAKVSTLILSTANAQACGNQYRILQAEYYRLTY
jgi:hypothetical protein